MKNHPGIDRYSVNSLDADQLSLLYSDEHKLNIRFSSKKDSSKIFKVCSYKLTNVYSTFCFFQNSLYINELYILSYA